MNISLEKKHTLRYNRIKFSALCYLYNLTSGAVTIICPWKLKTFCSRDTTVVISCAYSWTHHSFRHTTLKINGIYCVQRESQMKSYYHYMHFWSWKYFIFINTSYHGPLQSYFQTRMDIQEKQLKGSLQELKLSSASSSSSNDVGVVKTLGWE